MHVNAAWLDDIASVLPQGANEQSKFEHHVIASYNVGFVSDSRNVVGRENENREIDS